MGWSRVDSRSEKGWKLPLGNEGLKMPSSINIALPDLVKCSPF